MTPVPAAEAAAEEPAALEEPVFRPEALSYPEGNG
jgi:hypothetical protein